MSEDSPEELAAENARLKLENEKLKEQMYDRAFKEGWATPGIYALQRELNHKAQQIDLLNRRIEQLQQELTTAESWPERKAEDIRSRKNENE